MVTSMPGGAADKAGNRYEHRWVVLRISEMLEGRVTRIRPEPPGRAGTGIELTLDEDGITWGEQAKDTAANWTINKLTTEGVLDAVKTQTGLGRSFRFIASSAATDFGTLAEHARRTESFAEYAETLGKGRRAHLASVAAEWQVSEQEAWLMLQTVEVEHLPADALERIVATTLQRLYGGDPDSVVGELRNFCEQHVHRAFTAPEVAAHLESKGFMRRRIVGDENVLNGLHRTVERQQRRVNDSKPTIGFVPRNDAASVLNKLRDRDGGQVVIVDGRAGSGKSAIVSAVATALEEVGWFVAVARMDIDAAMATSDRLGCEIGLTESPTLLLAAVADGSPALLVIDQLDAVSTYSGRMPDNFDAVAETVAEVERTPNVKVLLVTRTVDLDADPRLRSLLRSRERVGRHTVGDLDIEDVKAQIAEHGMQVPSSDSTLELLRTPLHLSVFSRLSDAARELAYTTLQDLYARYTDEVRSSVERRAGGLEWDLIMGALVTHMSDNEVLEAPAAVLDAASRREVGVLVSESVLVRDGASVAFFHESYFDYLFARAFVAAGRGLRVFLLDSGQYLFRRAQMRQVLEHLAATDRRRFINVVVGLLTCDEIRSHLKDVVIRVLRQIQPSPEDWEALDELAWRDSRVGSKLVTLLNQPGWFDAADSLDMWETWLSDPGRVDAAFHQLVFVARERPARVAALVRPHIAESEEWRLRLRSLIEWSLKGELVDLAVELVELGRLDDARGPAAVNSDFWSIIYSVKDDDPVGAARLVGAFLRRCLVRAHQDGSGDPFASGHLSSHSQSASTVLGDVAANAPAEFVHHVLPFVVDVATVDQDQYEGLVPASRRWHYRHLSPGYSVDNAVFAATDKALRNLAGENPAGCATALQTLRVAGCCELRILACRALTAMGDPNDAIDWMISDPRNLVLGLSDGARWVSRELIQQCSPGCSADRFERLESVILDHSPSWESHDWRGYSQYQLLSALDETRMSHAARRNLQELQRRFPASPPQEPQPAVAQFVGSPIENDASEHMSDDDWIRALTKHNRNGTNWNGHHPVGGALELARVLGARAKDMPERFSRLALRFSEQIPAVAMNEIIDNIEGAVDIDALAEVCEHARDTYGDAVGRSVCGAIAHAGTASPRLVALLCACSRDPDPDHELARTGENLFGGDLYIAGLNSTRGQAALAGASILFSGTEHVGALRPAVETLVDDDVLAVRVCAAEAVVALLNHAPQQALDLAERLFDAPIDVLDALTSERLLTFAVLRDPDRFARVLADALDGPAGVAVRAGRIWAIARWRERLPSDIADDVRALPAAARRGAAEAFAENSADSLDDLPLVFNDDDPEVREQAARAMWDLDEVSADGLDTLIDAFVSSAAFPEHMEILINTLERMPSTLPASTITVCERAVDIAGADLGDLTTARARVSSDLVTVVLRLYRQGDKHLRARCLDLVDRLTDLNAYDMERALGDER